MAELIWTDKSVISLEDIYDYIAADSPHYARYQINSILKGAERLKTLTDAEFFPTLNSKIYLFL